MKSLLLLALVSILRVCVWAQTVPPSGQPFSITISGPTTDVSIGTGVEIRIRLTNTSDHEIKIPAFHVNGVDVSYSYDVRDNSGSLVEKKNRGRSVGSVTEHTVKPSESVEAGVLLSRAFDMSRAGQYVIQVSRAVSGDPKDGVVKSNTLTITVTP